MFGLAGQSYRVGQRPAAVTSPDVLPNLEHWYNADIGNTTNFNQALNDGDDVGQWKDRAGGGHNLSKSGNAAGRPDWYANQSGVGNTLGVIRFNGTTHNLDVNPVAWLQSLTGFSMFIVGKATTVGVGTRTMTATNTGGFQISHNTSNWGVTAASCTGVSTITGIADTSKFNIYGLIFDGTGVGNTGRLKFRYNKREETLTYTGTANTITSASVSTFYVGVGSLGNSGYFAGDIAEILIFKRVLNSSEVGGVESYMTAHWNL